MKILTKRKSVRWLVFGAAMLQLLVFLMYNKNDGKILSFPDLLKFTQTGGAILSKPFLVVPNSERDRKSPKNTIVLVLSKASNILQRKTIRQTWGNQDMQIKYNFSVYFVVGREEQDINDSGDIIQVDIEEDYDLLTDKTFAAFNWVTQFCQDERYFFKVDDDVFLDLDFLREIQNNSTYLPDDTVLGSCHFTASPARSTTDKWKVSYSEYPFKTYPPFCNGPGYIMTLRTAHKLYVEMTKTRQFKLEDVYVGMVAYRLGMSVKHVENFVYNRNFWLLNDFFYRCHTIIHYVTPDIIQHLWDGQEIIDREKIDCSIWGIVKLLFS